MHLIWISTLLVVIHCEHHQLNCSLHLAHNLEFERGELVLVPLAASESAQHVC
jgi:hypothetical protein